MSDLPASVLFACTTNSVRSPVAEAYLRRLQGDRIRVASVGIRAREIDGFDIAVMDEIGIDLRDFRAKTFEERELGAFELVIALSPEALVRAEELAAGREVEHWPIADPTLIEGNRETRLAAFREMRDALIARIAERFPPPPKPGRYQ